MEDKKKCPFCGSHYVQALKVDITQRGERFGVICLNCGARGPLATFAPDAVKRWNVRIRSVRDGSM